MPNASTQGDPRNEEYGPRVSNGEHSMDGDEPQLHSIEAGGPSNQKRQRQRQRQRQRLLSGTPAIHQCRICQRTYGRADRLSRHLKTHENARSYLCHRCEKSFNRGDLLTRHMRIHNLDDTGVVGPDHVGTHRSDRAGQACVACAAAKARCEDHKPCRRCRMKRITCEVVNQTSYGAQRQVPGNRGSQRSSESPGRNNARLQPPVSASQQQQEELQQQHPVEKPSAIEHQPSALIDDINHQSNPHTNHLVRHNEATNHETVRPELVEPTLAQMEIYDMHSMPMDGSQLVFDNVMNEIHFMPSAANFNNQNVDINFYDFTFQDELLDMFPAQPIGHSRSEAVIVEVTGQTPQPARDIRAGYAAFKKSPWLWTPAQRDHALHDEENLTLDEDSISSALTPTVPSCGFPTVSPAMRDKMYYLVSTMNKYTNRIPSFPSLDVINHILEAFFIRHTYQTASWIHVPSLFLSDAIPELSLALVIAGSTIISVPAIWKMGLVLQDVVRIKLAELWERDNSATRKLQPLQAWMLTLDAGLFSGFQRQMELAESFGQTMVTMMRRGGMFGATTDTQVLVPHESDTENILNAKWKKWIQCESFKRLSIHLFIHDTRASIALQKYPLISLTEITTSLPASQVLYLAGSATEWKSHFHQLKLTRPLPQLIDVVHNISILDDLHSEVDVNLCYTAAIHGFWCQIWAFRESWKFHAISDSRDSVHRLWLLAQQRELYQQIEAFKQNLLNMQDLRSKLLIMVELLLMIMHVSPEELQRFAGRYGEDEALQVLPNLDRWSGTEQARRAVWHAGQVFRWASLMPPTELRDFYAIAVYFASLALWTFGHLISSGEASNGSSNAHTRSSLRTDGNGNSNFVIVNSEEMTGTQSFIAGRQIIPILMPMTSQLCFEETASSQNCTAVRLDDPSAVLQMARDLYQNNFPIEGEPLPPLVENMGNLMRDLGNLTEKRFSRAVSPLEGSGALREQPTTSGMDL